MKRLGLVFVLLLVMRTTGNAGQMEGVEVSVSGGFAFPSSPMAFATYWKMQYGGGIGAGIPLTESITLVGMFEYYRFGLNKDGVSKGFNTDYMRDIWVFKDVTVKPSADISSVTTVSANVRFTPSKLAGWPSPYFVAGMGVMRSTLGEIALPTTSVISINGSDISMTAQQTITGGVETAAFFQFGIGVDLTLADSFDVFVEARYANGLGKGLGTTYAPITLGIRLRL